MRGWNFLAALPLLAMPLTAQTSNPASYLPKADHMCKATSADGTKYEVWDRILVTEVNGKPSYLPMRARYKPGSGEFLWRVSLGFIDEDHAIGQQEKRKNGETCPDNPRHHILLLQDHEWVDFWASYGTLEVSHSELKFDSLKKAWPYVAEHWQDGEYPFVGGSSAKLVEAIDLRQQLGDEFFRPESMKFSAQGYMYDSLISAKKVGANWEVELKGADERNRVTILLDSGFKVLTVTKSSATH